MDDTVLDCWLSMVWMSPDLKRKLYDRLKQGCLRLGYRPGKDLLLQKRINNHEDDDGDLPQHAAEPSEHSTITERTSPVIGITHHDVIRGVAFSRFRTK